MQNAPVSPVKSAVGRRQNDIAALLRICCNGIVGDGGLSVCLHGRENGGKLEGILPPKFVFSS